MPGFNGVPEDFFVFFEELARHNDRDWFAEHKARYHDSVVAPMLAFIEAVGPWLKKISPHYRADPRPHGGSLFRIHRDVRFARDKSPYKTHAACHFRHRAGRDAHAPGFYAHFEPSGLYFGGGIWRPPPAHLASIREAIVDNPAAWGRLRKAPAVQQRGGIQGEQLKRAPRGFDAGHRHVDDLRRKGFYVMSEAPPALARSAELLGEVEAAFRAAAPLNRFVCQALDLPF